MALFGETPRNSTEFQRTRVMRIGGGGRGGRVAAAPLVEWPVRKRWRRRRRIGRQWLGQWRLRRRIELRGSGGGGSAGGSRRLSTSVSLVVGKSPLSLLTKLAKLSNEERPIHFPATPKLVNNRAVAMLTASSRSQPSRRRADQERAADHERQNNRPVPSFGDRVLRLSDHLIDAVFGVRLRLGQSSPEPDEPDNRDRPAAFPAAQRRW